MTRPSSNLAPLVLVVGPAPAALATAAFPNARVEHGDMPRLISAAEATPAPDLVVIDAGVAGPNELSVALAMLARNPAPPPVLIIGSALPVVLARALLRLPHTDVVDSPASAASLASAARELLAAGRVGPGSAPTRCWAVTSAVGGAGATTVAIEVAAALARRGGPGRRTALIDLNLADGAAAAYLAVSPNMRLAEAADAPQRIDTELLAAFVTETAGGFDLIAAPRDPAAFDTIGAEAVLRVLDAACQLYDQVVVDLPRHRRAWTLPLLSGCDEVLVVSELTVPALLAARAFVAELEAALPPEHGPKVILNRLAKKMFGPAPSVSEAERALGRQAAGGLTSDWEAAAAAANLGGPISRQHPRSRIVKEVADLVDRLMADPQAGQGARAA